MAMATTACYPRTLHTIASSGSCLSRSAPRNTSLARVVEWVREAGYALEELPAEDFCRRMRALLEEHALFGLKAALSVASQYI